jgi:hypothetical protein
MTDFDFRDYLKTATVSRADANISEQQTDANIKWLMELNARYRKALQFLVDQEDPEDWRSALSAAIARNALNPPEELR